MEDERTHDLGDLFVLGDVLGEAARVGVVVGLAREEDGVGVWHEDVEVRGRDLISLVTVHLMS